MDLKILVKDLKDVQEYNKKTSDQIASIKKEAEEKINKIKEERQAEIFSLKEQSLKDNITIEAKQIFEETNNKSLAGGIGIKEITIYDYSAEDAFFWAKEHNMCLQLDKKAFEKIMKAQDLEFVKKDKKIQVTFPKIIKLEE